MAVNPESASEVPCGIGTLNPTRALTNGIEFEKASAAILESPLKTRPALVRNTSSRPDDPLISYVSPSRGAKLLSFVRHNRPPSGDAARVCGLPLFVSAMPVVPFEVEGA